MAGLALRPAASPGHRRDRPPPTTGGNHLVDSLTRLVTVRLYTEHSVLVGQANFANARLTDYLNRPDPYIALQDAQVYPGGAASPTALVPKSAVLFAVDVRDSAYQGFNAQMKLQRDQVQATVGLGLLTLSGVIHLPGGGELANWLQSPQRFVPLTAVTITPRGGQPLHEDVVLLNKDRVQYLST